ncbi:hypothetical protein ACFLYF_06575 [Chloroflexota bacterium]
MKKIGLLILAVIMTFGALGVGYAAWTDQIFINGTVNTGSVDLVIEELSSTLVYKDLDTDDLVVVHQRENLRDLEGGFGWHIVNSPAIPANGLLVASAMTTSPGDDMINIVIENAFPLVGEQDEPQLCADFLLHYVGSVPVIVDAVITDYQGDPEAVALLAAASEVHFYKWVDGQMGEEITDPVQLHYCDSVYGVLCLNIPQEDAYMNLSGSFSAEIRAVQWNEFGSYEWPENS